MNDIKTEAFQAIMKSPISLYFSEEQMVEVFSHITFYDTSYAFEKAYGVPLGENDTMEGFCRNGNIHINVNGSAHTIIHEVLHVLSITYDKDGHIVQNGISKPKHASSIYLNEGLTEYLASRISKKDAFKRHYPVASRFFERLDALIENVYGDQTYLYAMYFQKNDSFLRSFFSYYCPNKIGNVQMDYNYIKENFLFIGEEKLDLVFNNMYKNIKKRNKDHFLNRFMGNKHLVYEDSVIQTPVPKNSSQLT